MPSYSFCCREAERAIRDLFARARANLPCIVFFDEIDAIVGKRALDGGSGWLFAVLVTCGSFLVRV